MSAVLMYMNFWIVLLSLYSENVISYLILPLFPHYELLKNMLLLCNLENKKASLKN